MTTPTVAPEQRPTYWGTKIDSEHNLYQISDLVYRSEQPSQHLIPFLEAQQIKNIITLRSRNKSEMVFKHTGIQIHHVPIYTWALDREDMLQVMQYLKRAKLRQEKTLIHCYHGSDRTGASIAMYRIIFQNWSIDDAVKEMKHDGYGFHTIWGNIEKIFTPKNIAWIQSELEKTH